MFLALKKLTMNIPYLEDMVSAASCIEYSISDCGLKLFVVNFKISVRIKTKHTPRAVKQTKKKHWNQWYKMSTCTKINWSRKLVTNACHTFQISICKNCREKMIFLPLLSLALFCVSLLQRSHKNTLKILVIMQKKGGKKRLNYFCKMMHFCICAHSN